VDILIYHHYKLLEKTMLRWFKIVFLLIPILVFISACAKENSENIVKSDKSKATIQKGTNHVYRRSEDYSLNTQDKNVTVTPASNDLSSEERAQIVAEGIAEIESITSVSAVITENTVIVGIQTDVTYDDSELSSLKRQIEEKVKSVDKGIVHISITTSENLIERINSMPDVGIYHNSENNS
jgi:YhcN/YlaJ family sporulation lipoprotein